MSRPRKYPRKPKWVGGLLRGLADDRHVQASADYVSDVSNRHALSCNYRIEPSSA
jgi:hypothetical protein